MTSTMPIVQIVLMCCMGAVLARQVQLLCSLSGRPLQAVVEQDPGVKVPLTYRRASCTVKPGNILDNWCSTYSCRV